MLIILPKMLMSLTKWNNWESEKVREGCDRREMYRAWMVIISCDRGNEWIKLEILNEI